jgi:glycosyltransferase involved in cell wall biosynthesis
LGVGHRKFPEPPVGKTGWPWNELEKTPTKRAYQADTLPLISIVTPSFNQGRFLEKTIRSVLLQDYPNIEYIIIDGKSSDNSIAIIEKYAKWIDYWISEPDMGQAHAINKGFALSNGQILGYINSDDWYAANAFKLLSLLYQTYKSPELALLCGDVQDMYQKGPGQYHQPMGLGKIWQWVYGGVSLHQPGCFWTKGTWLRYGPLLENLHYVFDRYFFARISGDRIASFIKIPALLAYFRHHECSKTFLNRSRFADEWHMAVTDLERQLPAKARLYLAYHRWQTANWEAVRKASNAKTVTDSAKVIFKRLGHSPFALVHRPILGVLKRLFLRCLEK